MNDALVLILLAVYGVSFMLGTGMFASGIMDIRNKHHLRVINNATMNLWGWIAYAISAGSFAMLSYHASDHNEFKVWTFVLGCIVVVISLVVAFVAAESSMDD